MVAKIIRISSVTDYERALLIGHYLSISDQTGVDPRLLEKGYTEAQIKQMRDHMGKQSVIGAGLRFEKDLDEYRHPRFSFIYTLYDAWSSHDSLPFSGSFSEQPNQVVDYFHILDTLTAEAEKKVYAEAKRNANKKGK